MTLHPFPFPLVHSGFHEGFRKTPAKVTVLRLRVVIPGSFRNCVLKLVPFKFSPQEKNDPQFGQIFFTYPIWADFFNISNLGRFFLTYRSNFQVLFTPPGKMKKRTGPFLGEPFVKFQEKWSCSSLLTFQYLDFATLRCLEKVKHILPTGGLMLIYHGTIRKKNTLSKNSRKSSQTTPEVAKNVRKPTNRTKPTNETNKQTATAPVVCLLLPLEGGSDSGPALPGDFPHLDVPGRKLGSKVRISGLFHPNIPHF